MSSAVLIGPGSVVGGDFVIRSALDEGGMGAVYVAEQRSTGKLRALKLMHRQIAADPVLQRRFEQEARAASRIRSEHVVEVLAAGIDAPSGLPYLVMELLEGEDLRHRIDAAKALPRDEVATVFEQLCHAMSAAHEGGVVHRDLKPENVFLARTRRAGSAPFTVKVLDFGIAKIEAEAGTRATKGAVGSPMWMAPEQTAPGPVTAAADVWALGLLAYEMLTGRSFWRSADADGGTTAQLLREIILDPIPAATARAREQGEEARLPPGFDAWFARCVARDPTHRHTNATVLWRAMTELFPDRAASRPDLAATLSAPPEDHAAPLMAGETGDATPFIDAIAKARSTPPVSAPPPSKRPLSTTPLESTLDPPRLRASSSSNRPILIAVAIAATGILAGVFVATRSPTPVTALAPPALPSPPAPAAIQPPAPLSSPLDVPVPVPVPSRSSPPQRAPIAIQPPSASPSIAPPKLKPLPLASGFTDPTDRNGPVIMRVQARPIRILTRLVSNTSNVTDDVVRKGIDWSSWEYIQCYQRAFSAAKDMPEGTVIVGFDILDQLPRHAALVSSTIESPLFNDCVVNTLLGHTLNAAGPEGRGHAVQAFRFIPN